MSGTRIILFLVLSGFTNSLQTFSQKIDSLIQDGYEKSYSLYQEGKFEDAETNFKSLLDLNLQYRKEDYSVIGDIYLRLGVINKQLYQFDEALKYYAKAGSYYKKINEDNQKLPWILNNEATVFMSRHDISKAYSYLAQAENIIKRNHNPDKYALGAVYGNLGIIHAFQGNFKKTNEYTELSENLLASDYPYNLYQTYSTITTPFYYKENTHLAQFYFSKRKLLLDTKLSYNIRAKIQFLLDYGYFLQNKLGKTDEAFKYLNYAEVLTRKEFPPDNPIFLNVYEILAKTAYSSKDYYHALEYFQRLLVLASGFSGNLPISFNPNVNDITYDRYGYEAAKYKARILYSSYLKNKDSKSLQNSLKALDISIELLNSIRLRFDSESSQFLIGSEEKEIYQLGQQIAYSLFRTTGDSKYADLAFQINEQGRAFTLLSSLRSQKAIEYGGIPFEMTKKETELNNKISAYTEMIMNEKEKISPDSSKIGIWESRLFDYSRQYEDLVETIEKNYPGYYRLKYDNTVISMDQIRKKISRNDIVVEYSLMDSLLYTYIISKDSSSILVHTIDNSLDANCHAFYNAITDQSFSHDASSTYSEYVTLGYSLYRELFEPVEPYVAGKNVIVVPDGSIYYVPFEALLEHSADTSTTNYYQLPYLLYDHAFSTSYSSTLHFSKIPQSSRPLNEILAFAPTYENLQTDENVPSLRQSDRDVLINIPGVREEVKMIAGIMDCQIYKDREATETNFKKHASDYKILHLAMHTIIDDENPLYSKLAFTQNVDSLNDGFLHTYEIYNMKIRASLAVLSSCESGFGKFQEGEGMQSLARGFTYAGCPSILMTLWEVADQSTVSVMDRFYYYLGKGQSKSEALRSAKLDFLANADQLKSNPFFWSSFVIIGNTEPVFISNFWKIIIYVFSFFILVATGFFMYHRYKIEATIDVT